MTPTREILTTARALIATPDKWTQGAYRRDAAGEMCKPENAVCWCAVGALADIINSPNLTEDDELRIFEEARHAIEKANQITTLESFNDAPNRTHAEVLAAFDRAIEAEGVAQ